MPLACFRRYLITLPSKPVEVGWGKVVCWSTKAAISLKRAKIGELLLWRAYRNSPTRFLSNGTIPEPLRPLLPQVWGLQPRPKTAIAVVSGTGEATDFKFGRNIHRVFTSHENF